MHQKRLGTTGLNLQSDALTTRPRAGLFWVEIG